MDIDILLLSPLEMMNVIYGIPAREPGEDYSRLMEATAKAQLDKIKRAGYVQLDENQELPDVATRDFPIANALEIRMGYKDAGFRKIKGG